MTEERDLSWQEAKQLRRNISIMQNEVVSLKKKIEALDEGGADHDIAGQHRQAVRHHLQPKVDEGVRHGLKTAAVSQMKFVLQLRLSDMTCFFFLKDREMLVNSGRSYASYSFFIQYTIVACFATHCPVYAICKHA